MKKLIGFVLFFLFTNVYGTNIQFLPQFKNYFSSDYQAGNQNWSISQNSDEELLFGNNRGLLLFDGFNWKLSQISNNTPVRSVYCSKNGRIYVGAYEEFGYFQKDGYNNYIYTSLSQKMPFPVGSQEEFWSIIPHGNQIIFQSFSGFYVYDGVKTLKGQSPKGILYIFKMNNELFCQFIGGGIGRFSDLSFSELIDRKHFNNDDVVAFLPYDKDEYLLFTSKSGAFVLDQELNTRAWQGEFNNSLKKDICNRVIFTQDSLFIVGTIRNGVIAINKSGERKWALNKNDGIINNTVLSLFEDARGSLWVGTDNGISVVHKSSPLSIYKSRKISLGMVYDLYEDNNNFYFCTNQGLYAVNQDNEELIKGTENQCWFISKIDDQLFLGHNEGVFEIQGREASLLKGPYGGGLSMRKYKIRGKEVLFQLSYSTLSVFIKGEDRKWKHSHVISELFNRIKSFEVSPDGTIWAVHQYAGVYRIRLDDALKKIKEIRYYKNFQASQQLTARVDVMQFKGHVVFSTLTGFYVYDDVTGSVIEYKQLNQQLSELKRTYMIKYISDDLYWFIGDDGYTLVESDSNKLKILNHIPLNRFESPPIELFANVFVKNNDVSYFNLDGAIARYDFAKARHAVDTIPHLFLSSVTCFDKYTENGKKLLVYSTDSVLATLDPAMNSLRFDISAPFCNTGGYEIQTCIEGFDDVWRSLNPGSVLEVSNLNAGLYKLKVRLLDKSGDEKRMLQYPFKVSKYWYFMNYMILIYFLILIMLVYLAVKWIIRNQIKIRNEQIEKDKQLHLIKLNEQEQRIDKLEKEKLQEELSSKRRELTNTALALKSSDEFLSSLKSDFNKQIKANEDFKHYLSSKIRDINNYLSRKEDWEMYLTHFDCLNEPFFKQLKSSYPDLTPGDLRVCAFLRMNMPSKDIARFQNISIRGVEAARYRLRRKLEIDESVNLVEFIQAISSTE